MSCKAKGFLKLLNKEADRAFLHLPFDLMTQTGQIEGVSAKRFVELLNKEAVRAFLHLPFDDTGQFEG